MKGDKLVMQKGHVKVARQIMELLFPQIMKTRGKFIIVIAGEFDRGKSEIAIMLSEYLDYDSNLAQMLRTS